MCVDNIGSILGTSDGIIFVNRETKKYELWRFTGNTKEGNNWKAASNFRRIITTDEYDEILAFANVLKSTISNEHIEELQTINLLKKVEYRSFNSVTGAIGEEGSSSIPCIIMDIQGIDTNDIYVYSQFGNIHGNATSLYVYDYLGTFIGAVMYDNESSTSFVRHFVIPDNVSKIVIRYLTDTVSIYATLINVDIPYGIYDREYSKLTSEFTYLGETVENIDIDISDIKSEFKHEIYLKAGREYIITSTYNGTFYLVDIKGNKTSITLGVPFSLTYDCFYIYSDFINTEDKENQKLQFKSTIISNSELQEEIANANTQINAKADKEPFSIFYTTVKGTFNVNTGEVSYTSGTSNITEFIPISPKEIIYCFGYINGICFYDANKKFMGNGTVIAAHKAYKSPLNAAYMVFSLPGGGSGSVGFVYNEDDYETIGGDQIISLCQADKTRFRTLVNNAKCRTLYVIGDSEAARFRTNIPKIGSLVYAASASLGGIADDGISSNVGSTTGLANNFTFKTLKGVKVIVQAGTNGFDEPRYRAHSLEIVKRCRELGASEIWGMCNCMGLSVTYEEFKANKKHEILKAIYGGHFIDFMEVVYNMGLYYNLYHPKAFVQPSVGSTVDIYFDTIQPFIDFSNNPIFEIGGDFYMQYYDDKYDIYTVVSIDEESNKITASLKTNNSDIAPGETAGQYEESIQTSVYSGTKITKGFIYTEEDITYVEATKPPYNIYTDHVVHYGLILSTIIEQMLFAAGAVDNLDNDE